MMRSPSVEYMDKIMTGLLLDRHIWYLLRRDDDEFLVLTCPDLPEEYVSRLLRVFLNMACTIDKSIDGLNNEVVKTCQKITRLIEALSTDTKRLDQIVMGILDSNYLTRPYGIVHPVIVKCISASPKSVITVVFERDFFEARIVSCGEILDILDALPTEGFTADEDRIMSFVLNSDKPMCHDSLPYEHDSLISCVNGFFARLPRYREKIMGLFTDLLLERLADCRIRTIESLINIFPECISLIPKFFDPVFVVPLGNVSR